MNTPTPPTPPAGPAPTEPTGPTPMPPAPPAEAPLSTLRSDDGRLTLTHDRLEVQGQTFGLLELEGVELTPVRWLLWFLLGGFALAGFLLAFLQNWLRTTPAMLGVAAGALLLAYGTRGTNRLRLFRLGREAVYFSLPGAPEPWHRLAAETNRCIRQRHDEAAAAAAALLAWQAEQEAATAAAQLPAASTDPSFFS
ncbi:hypothetical protein SAMN02745146_3249 [Hymenobacter daecheongensis DSM 21074]|uniref:Uncharacterized protein n=1 Tax=Hymenobacter daecheongensis DSM 21074 TaxID=1121955 RepID=A0A1M6JSB5_9BACT|nr:hypothetical protein [Hymenobacter daecheongensis]SHJ49635.1 hypothetical protein SAMN02745146_3249 [Hymenobacter daecheongensis DSM 21074]